MKKFINLCAAVVAAIAFSTPAMAQNAKTLDELLQMIDTFSNVAAVSHYNSRRIYEMQAHLGFNPVLQHAAVRQYTTRVADAGKAIGVQSKSTMAQLNPVWHGPQPTACKSRPATPQAPQAAVATQAPQTPASMPASTSQQCWSCSRQ